MIWLDQFHKAVEELFVAAGVGNWFFLMVGLGLVSLADDGIGEGSKESFDDFRCLVELVLDVVTQKCELRSE